MTPQQLEPWFQGGETKLYGSMTHLNNPKINLSFIRAQKTKLAPEVLALKSGAR
jgi:hypothetical protein